MQSTYAHQANMAEYSVLAAKMTRLLALAHIVVGILLICFGIADRLVDYYYSWTGELYFGIWIGLWVGTWSINTAFIAQLTWHNVKGIVDWMFQTFKLQFIWRIQRLRFFRRSSHVWTFGKFAFRSNVHANIWQVCFSVILAVFCKIEGWRSQIMNSILSFGLPSTASSCWIVAVCSFSFTIEGFVSVSQI